MTVMEKIIEGPIFSGIVIFIGMLMFGSGSYSYFNPSNSIGFLSLSIFGGIFIIFGVFEMFSLAKEHAVGGFSSSSLSD
jgi:hypothetical protein